MTNIELIQQLLKLPADTEVLFRGSMTTEKVNATSLEALTHDGKQATYILLQASAF